MDGEYVDKRMCEHVLNIDAENKERWKSYREWCTHRVMKNMLMKDKEIRQIDSVKQLIRDKDGDSEIYSE